MMYGRSDVMRSMDEAWQEPSGKEIAGLKLMAQVSKN
jgi:hypothetical protein